MFQSINIVVAAHKYHGLKVTSRGTKYNLEVSFFLVEGALSYLFGTYKSTKKVFFIMVFLEAEIQNTL